jgi:hypothetical protein
MEKKKYFFSHEEITSEHLFSFFLRKITKGVFLEKDEFHNKQKSAAREKVFVYYS